MRIPKKFNPLVSGALLVLVSAGMARGDQYTRRDGTTFEATVLSASADDVHFRLKSGVEQVLGRAELDPTSHYRALQSDRAPIDAIERLSLARVCLEAQLFGPARLEARAAADAEPALAGEIGEFTGLVDEGEARALLTRGLELLASGDGAGAPLLLQVVNRFPATAALPAAAGALRAWAQDPKPAAGANGGATAENTLLTQTADGALLRARAHRDAGLAAGKGRGDKRERAFAAAETELEAARRAVRTLRDSGRAPAAQCDKRLLELEDAFVELCVAAGRALIESRRTKAAHRFIYRGLTLRPDHGELLALQSLLAGAVLEDSEDPSKMPLGELARRVARGSATEEMRRIYRRRAQANGLDPDAGTPAPAPGQVPPNWPRPGQG